MSSSDNGSDRGSATGTSTGPARPPQATFAAWLVIVSSVYVVMTSIERLGTLTSLAARERAQELLAGNGALGSMSVDTILGVERWGNTAAAVCAAIAAVLAFFAWRRDLTARKVLAVVAIPLFVAGLATSSIFTMVAAMAVILLWREPVASWYAGRPLPTAPARGPLDRLARPGAALHDPRAGRAADWTALPPVGGGALPGASGQAPRPRQATTASIITWVFGTLSVIMAIATLAVVIADPQLLHEEMLKTAPELADRGLTVSMMQTSFIISGLALLALAITAIVFAMGLLQRKRWGALGLMSVCWVIAVFCALGLLIGQLAMLLPGAAAVWVIVLVRARDTRVWVLTAPRPDGSGPAQFADQAPYGSAHHQGQFPGQPPAGPYPPQQPGQPPFPGQYPAQPPAGPYPPQQTGQPPFPGQYPVPPPADGQPGGEGRRRADVPIDAPSNTGQFPPLDPGQRKSVDPATGEESAEEPNGEPDDTTHVDKS